MALQETKLRVVDRSIVNWVCGHGDWGFSYSASVGAVGGILCYWNQSVFELEKCVSE